MMRGSTHSRHLAWLALAAALLMAFAPAVSRVVVAAASKATPVLMELCTASGLKVIDVAPFVGALEETPATPHVMEEACAYCTLLPPLAFALLVLCALLLRPLPALSPRLHRFFPAFPRNLRSLGSQAPPLFS